MLDAASYSTLEYSSLLTQAIVLGIYSTSQYVRCCLIQHPIRVQIYALSRVLQQIDIHTYNALHTYKKLNSPPKRRGGAGDFTDELLRHLPNVWPAETRQQLRGNPPKVISNLLCSLLHILGLWSMGEHKLQGGIFCILRHTSSPEFLYSVF